MRRFSAARGSVLFLKIAVGVTLHSQEPRIVDLGPKQHVIGHVGAIDRRRQFPMSISRIWAAVCVSPHHKLASLLIDKVSNFLQNKHELRRGFCGRYLEHAEG